MTYKHFTATERGQLQAFVSQGKSRAFMARVLGRDPSSIGRELRRNDAQKRPYDADRAQKRYNRVRKECVKTRKLDYLPLRQVVYEKILENHSPDQVARRIRLDYPDDPGMRISHEAIYQAIYGDERFKPLIKHLRQARQKRRKRGMGKSRRGSSIPNRVSIERRPKHVEERKELGHWEGDTVIGKNQKGVIATLVERKSLFLQAVHMTSKHAEGAARAIIETLGEMPDCAVKTITFDNGTEFAAHEKITAALRTPVYFAHPYSSNERARNENTNGLLRQYLPKGTCFENLSREKLNDIVNELNNRPRKTLGYRTPHEVFYNLNVALAA